MRSIIPYYYLSNDPNVQINIKSFQRLRFIFEDIFWFVLVFNMVPQLFLSLEVDYFYINFFTILFSGLGVCAIQFVFYIYLYRVSKNDKDYDIQTVQFGNYYKEYYKEMRTLLVFKVISISVVVTIVGLGNLVLLIRDNTGQLTSPNIRIATMVTSLMFVVGVVFLYEVFQYRKENTFGKKIVYCVQNIKHNIIESGKNILIEDGDIVTTLALSNEYLEYVYPSKECMQKTLALSSIKSFLVFCMYAALILIGVVCFFARNSESYKEVIKMLSAVSSLVFICAYTLLDVSVVGLSNRYNNQQLKFIKQDPIRYRHNITLMNSTQNIHYTNLARYSNIFLRLVVLSIGFVLGTIFVFVWDKYAFLVVLFTFIGLFLYVCLALPFFSVYLQRKRLQIILKGRAIWGEENVESSGNNNRKL